MNRHQQRYFYCLSVCFLVFLLNSCSQANKPVKEDKEKTGEFVSAKTTKVKNGNLSVIFSSDETILGKILALQFAKPASVQFKYTFTDSTGTDDLHTVPPLSNNSLEALLQFDSTGFKTLMDSYKIIPRTSAGVNKETFAFSWLDSSTRAELDRSDSSYRGDQDIFFSKPQNSHCHLWILKNKILLYKFGN